MSSVPRLSEPAAAELEHDLHELQLLLPTLFHALRHPGAGLVELEPYKQAFYDAGLRERHGRLLLALATMGPLTVGELAARVALASATTSLLVGELDRAGFVERHEDDSDRRRTIISLPARMRPAFEHFAETRLAPLRRTLEQLEPTTRRHFIEGMRTLNAEACREE